MGGASKVLEAPGKAFEQRVADAYKTLGFQVTPNVQLGGKQTDLLARHDIAGGPTVKLAIECKDHAKAVGNADVLTFVARVAAQVASSAITGGVLVSASGFTADARAVASDNSDVTLLSWSELSSQIFDVRNQLREAVGHYEASAIFQDYLPLATELLRWSTMTQERSREATGEEVLEEWLGFDGRSGLGILFILADFGAGKTTLLRNLEYNRAVAYLEGEDDRIPLFVPLREYRQSQDVGTLLRASFRDAYYRDIPTDLLWQRIESGNLFILLDGFDEMLDRSDAGRRLELFHELMPILRSPSPAILTSRPSYLVERGELDHLLSRLREQEAAIAAPVTAEGSHALALAEVLRRKLVERHREVRPSKGMNDPLEVREVEVIRLLPLDDEQIEEFVSRHQEELKTVGASVPDVLSFIKRTYDLSDLASRPMLLNLIISSVVIGGLDLSDTSTQYGASSLYEIYTNAKLDLDMAKGRSRQNGLSRTTRRMLAEEVALEMYQNNVLELDFHSMLEKLRSRSRTLAEALGESGLTDEEIRTDFATCSFITVDNDGKCRFVHKSFRGFFIARTLKKQLRKLHPMLSETLEREILYFLGNFAPTEAAVEEQLWANFLHADEDAVVLRRNLLVAFLNAKPVHDTRKISGGLIEDAEFGRLRFEGTRLQDTTWKNTVVRNLEVVEAKWDVRLDETNITQFRVSSSDLKMHLAQSDLEELTGEASNLVLGVDRSQLHGLRLVDSTARVVADGVIGQLEAKQSDMAFKASQVATPVLTDAMLEESRLRISGEWGAGLLGARRSVLICDGSREAIGRWGLEKCFLLLTGDPGKVAGVATDRRTLTSDWETVILAPDGLPQNLLTSRAGIFGSLEAVISRRPLQLTPRAWGCLLADEVLDAVEVPTSKPGARFGNLLLVRAGSFSDHDKLPALTELDQLLTREFKGGETLTILEDKRAELRHQYEELLKGSWPNFGDYRR
jgi:hypothetical protein